MFQINSLQVVDINKKNEKVTNLNIMKDSNANVTNMIRRKTKSMDEQQCQ